MKALNSSMMVSEPLCKEFWLERIPHKIRILIAPSMNLPLDDLAKQADSISELPAKNKSCLTTTAAVTASVVPAPQLQPSISNPVESANLLCMQEMTKELAAIRADRNCYRQYPKSVNTHIY